MSGILEPCLLALKSNCYSSNAYHRPGKVLSTPKDRASFSPAVGRAGGRGESGGYLCVSSLGVPGSADWTAQRLVLSAGTRSGPLGGLFVDGG